MTASNRSKFLLLGDSLTQLSFGGWGSELADVYQRRADVLNRGMSGYNSRWYLRYAEETGIWNEPGKVALVTIFFGANDAAKKDLEPKVHVPLDEYKANIEKLVDKAKESYPNAEILIMAPPPVHPEQRLEFQKKRYGDKATGVLERTSEIAGTYAAACREVAKAKEVPCVELNDISPTVAATVTINDTSTTVVSGQEVLTNAGSGTFTVPGGVSNISIMAVGGGAGSGTASALGAGQISGGGGSGAVAWLNNVTVSAGDSISYTVGAGGAGNNDGGDTTVTIGGTTYTAGGGSASAPVSLTDLDPYELHAGGAGGTASGAWTGSVNGGVGGSSYRSQTGQAYVGGGAGGSGQM